MTTSDANEQPRGRPVPPRREQHVPAPSDDLNDPSNDDEGLEVNDEELDTRTVVPRKQRREDPEPEPMEVPPNLSPQTRKNLERGYEDMLAAFDFKSADYKAVLIRKKPQLFKGRELGGWLGRYDEPLPTEEVKNTFGGGTYEWQVHGPNPRLGGKQSILKSFLVTIAGDPVVPPTPGEENANADTGLVRDLIAAKDRDVARATKEVDELRKVVMQQAGRSDNGVKEIVATLAQVLNPQQSRELVEARIREEREERKAEAAAAERRHQELLKSMELRHQEQMETMRLQHERELREVAARAESDRKAAEAAAASKAQTSDTMVMLLQKIQQDQIALIRDTAAVQEKRTQEAQAFMNQLQQSQQSALMEQMRQLEGMKSEFLLKQIERMETKREDPLESITKLVQLREVFDDLSGRSDRRETWEKVADTVKEAAPGLMAAFAGIRTGPPAAAAAPRMAPNTVAMVDLPPAGPAPPRRVKRKKKPAPTSFTEGLKPEAKPPAPPPDPVWTPTPPAEGSDTEAQVKHLVQQLEKALQFDWDLKQIYDRILPLYSKDVRELLKMTGAEQCMLVIEQLTPADWAINTLRGKQMITDLLGVLLSSG